MTPDGPTKMKTLAGYHSMFGSGGGEFEAPGARSWSIVDKASLRIRVEYFRRPAERVNSWMGNQETHNPPTRHLVVLQLKFL